MSGATSLLSSQARATASPPAHTSCLCATTERRHRDRLTQPPCVKGQVYGNVCKVLVIAGHANDSHSPRACRRKVTSTAARSHKPLTQPFCVQAQAYVNVCKVLAERGRTEEAVEVLSRVIAAQPAVGEARALLGRCALSTKGFVPQRDLIRSTQLPGVDGI